MFINDYNTFYNCNDLKYDIYKIFDIFEFLVLMGLKYLKKISVWTMCFYYALKDFHLKNMGAFKNMFSIYIHES
jgi:hypothetical protein